MAEPTAGIEIRAETLGDEAAIYALNDLAFDGPEESRIIAALKRERLVALSLVAEEKSRILGHILFSWLAVTIDDRRVPAVALAPMAVHPDRQGRGLGSRLVREGLARVASLGAAAAIVVGHPGFYPRFGFSAEMARKLKAPFSGAAFMALELETGALAGEIGEIAYPAAFGLENDA